MSDEKPKNMPPVETRFKKGMSGNPGGKPVATRNKITANFLLKLAKDFEDHGEDAIKRCREENPAAYVKTIATLLPKEVEIKRPLEDFDDDELIAAVGALQSFLASREAEAGVGDPTESPQTH